MDDRLKRADNSGSAEGWESHGPAANSSYTGPRKRACVVAGPLSEGGGANPYIDGAASIVIGLILASVVVLLGSESKGLLLGESTDLGRRPSCPRSWTAHPSYS